MILLLPFPFLAVVDLYLTWPIAQCNGANTLAAALAAALAAPLALHCTGRAVTLSPAKRADPEVCVLSRRGFP
jgi:multisubunit Na+/H+ antiporter MnhG subunit